MKISDREYQEALKYRTIIRRVGIVFEIEPSLIAGICSRESAFGLSLHPQGPAGTGDSGHGHGLMQLDDRWHAAFCATDRWKDPDENINEAVEMVLKPNLNAAIKKLKGASETDRLMVAIAGYNCGFESARRAYRDFKDPDKYTTGGNYALDVLARASFFTTKGWI